MGCRRICWTTSRRSQQHERDRLYSVFISYSRADKSFARRLHNDLQAAGIRVWLDEHEILPGDKFKAKIDEGIRIWDKVILCCSEASLKSWWVDKEIERALQKEQRLAKEADDVLALIPVSLDSAVFGWDGPHAPTWSVATSRTSRVGRATTQSSKRHLTGSCGRCVRTVAVESHRRSRSSAKRSREMNSQWMDLRQSGTSRCVGYSPTL